MWCRTAVSLGCAKIDTVSTYSKLESCVLHHDQFIYRCPVCREGLGVYGRSLKCANGHSYDIAKEGYVNLLLANQKRSQEPGDNKKMISHRRQFFASGLYEPLSNEVNKIAQTFLASHEGEHSFNLLDSGCGEGYFLHRINTFLREDKRPYSLWGIDISKFAIKSAAKQDKSVQWAVASSFDLPVLPGSVDFVLNMMAPFSEAEFARVLRGNGRILVVTPGPNHLFSLRQQIYENPQKHEMPNQALPGFQLATSQRVQFTCELQNEDIVNLFVMTPYSWNASPATREKVMSLEKLSITVDFVLTLFQKGSAQP
jgi:23S rRNA (guanine745-N1)-methyltransferase